MNKQVTIVMYHYVRDLAVSRFPDIKGLSLERFGRQLDFIRHHYTPIRVEDLLNALSTPMMELPPNSILLTFDDGYCDHFTNVCPLLDAHGIQGCFFPPAQAILEHKVLDVNKIHFVLASHQDAATLLKSVFIALEEFRSDYPLKSREDYLRTVNSQHRYDSPEVTILKRLLQRELPEPVRAEIVRRLFATHVTADEAAFACELYMSLKQLIEMRNRGMHIGSHGYTHAWLNRISPEAQEVEVDRSLQFLQKIGIGGNDWTICYPYGGFNDSLLQILRARNCQLGFTADARVADLNRDSCLTLPRLDTNDLPS